MKNMLIAGFALVLLVASFAACQNTPKVVNNVPNAAYACPMHPEITGKMGDKCSKCGMDLAQVNQGVEASTGPASTPMSSVATSTDTKASKSPLSSVYDAYFSLKNALAKDDGKSAEEAAKTLFDEISAVQMDKLDPVQHAVWMKLQKKLSFDAEHIKSVDETKHQREHFVSLSKNMHEVMTLIKNDVPVYYQNCPMYNGGKGANWLSLDSKISNPYLGKSMPTCGKTVETIQ